MRALSTPGSPVASALRLFALSGLAWAAPALGLLERHPELLAAHRVTPGELGALVACLLLGPPLAAWLVERAVALGSRRAAFAVHLVFVSGLSACFALPPIAWLPLSGWLAVTLAAAVGAWVAFGCARRRDVRAFLALLAVLPVGSAIAFATDANIVKLLRPSSVEVEPVALETDAPIVVVVFDELPVTSLLDATGGIDAGRFPHFAALAARSVWFRNTTTVAASTSVALPAILTGNYPGETDVAVRADHPRNLFSLFAATHRMHVLEERTFLFEGEGSSETEGQLLSELGLLTLHEILPRDLTSGLPDVTQDWKDFDPDGDRRQRRRAAFVDRGAKARRFIDEIATFDEPTLHFLHLMLPHQPWQYLPSGGRYVPDRTAGLLGQEWSSEAWWSIQGYQRHLFQAMFVDRLLGELIAQLERLGLWDRSLVAVLADHGAAFWPGESLRKVGKSRHPEDILRIPLFLKLPGQREARRSERIVETVDVLPSLVDALGVSLPWQVDGCSALSDRCPERAELRVVHGKPRQHAGLSPSLHGETATLERKLALFGSGPDPASLFRVGPLGALVGLATAKLAIAGTVPVTIQLSTQGLLEGPPGRTPARVLGRFPPPVRTGGIHVALATAGRIRAVAPAFPHDDVYHGFSAMLPEGALGGPAEDLAVFVIVARSDGPAIFRAPHRFEEFSLPRLGAAGR